MSEHTPSPLEMVELLREVVQGRVSFADLFAEDGVLEYPFSAPGFPTVYKGQEIREWLSRMADMRNLFEIHEVTAVAHETTDPELVIAEISHKGHSHATNRPYEVTA